MEDLPGRSQLHVQDPSGHPVPRRLAVDGRRRQGQLRQDPQSSEGVRSIRKHHYSAVASVEAPDPATVVFKLKFPSASLLANLASPSNVIFPKKYLDKDPNY